MIHRHFYIDFGNMYLNIQNAYQQQNSNIKAAWYEEKPTFEESLTYRICITSYFHNVFFCKYLQHTRIGQRMVRNMQVNGKCNRHCRCKKLKVHMGMTGKNIDIV